MKSPFTKTVISSNWVKAVLLAVVPMVFLLSFNLVLNNMAKISMYTAPSYFSLVRITLLITVFKAVLYALFLCFLYRKEKFTLFAQNIVGFYLPAAYLFALLIFYFIPDPLVYRYFGPVFDPAMLFAAYVWKTVFVLRITSNNSRKV